MAEASLLNGVRPDHRGSLLFPRNGPATAAALFHGVDGGPLGPADPDIWDAELPVLLGQRLSGLAIAAARRCGVQLATETSSRLQQSHMRSVATALTVESTALPVLAELEHHGIPLVVTKGPGITRVYPQTSLRPFGDLDVLVPPEAFDRSLRAIRSLGFTEYFDEGEPHPYFDRLCREGVNLIRADGGSIDLHHHVPPWVWGRHLGFRELFATSQVIEVAGGIVRVPHPVHNLLIAALHVTSDRKAEPGQKLLTWRDVVALTAVCDPEAVVREARRANLDWYLEFILRQLPQNVRPARLLELLGRPRTNVSDRFRRRRLLPPSLGSRHQIAAAFRLPLPNAAAFLVGYVFPSPSFLERRFGSRFAYVTWWRDAVSRLREATHSRVDSSSPIRNGSGQLSAREEVR